jgi:hypothetical protein
MFAICLIAESEATKAYLFLEFVRSIFIIKESNEELEVNYPHKLYRDLEKSIKSDKVLIVMGRIDALLGNIIIEFEIDLGERNLEEAKKQLRKYSAILWNMKGLRDYLCIASDGINFRGL